MKGIKNKTWAKSKPGSWEELNEAIELSWRNQLWKEKKGRKEKLSWFEKQMRRLKQNQDYNRFIWKEMNHFGVKITRLLSFLISQMRNSWELENWKAFSLKSRSSDVCFLFLVSQIDHLFSLTIPIDWVSTLETTNRTQWSPLSSLSFCPLCLAMFGVLMKLVIEGFRYYDPVTSILFFFVLKVEMKPSPASWELLSIQVLQNCRFAHLESYFERHLRLGWLDFLATIVYIEPIFQNSFGFCSIWISEYEST